MISKYMRVLQVFYCPTLMSVMWSWGSVMSLLELQQLLSLGGFQLCKFTSNYHAVLEGLSPEAMLLLRLQWNPSTDTFGYDIQSRSLVLTKYGILSDIAQVFDLLGWLSPLTFIAKHLIQQL
ncbi:hypothetical protein PR048_017949 [Dryococelus australis]|uniref:Uncharacterized protein n=1 Tax=Dryococelus australis TaxID=614101 RepID=A0ABQ9HBI2_9NEOP|nr:hypothetical protein PR048_017949 [Dryococelus australis]